MEYKGSSLLQERKLVEPLWEEVWRFPENLVELPYNPAIPFLVIYLIWKNIGTPVFKTTLLPSHQKEWNNAICSNMDRPRGYHTK